MREEDEFPSAEIRHSINNGNKYIYNISKTQKSILGSEREYLKEITEIEYCIPPYLLSTNTLNLIGWFSPLMRVAFGGNPPN